MLDFRCSTITNKCKFFMPIIVVILVLISYVYILKDPNKLQQYKQIQTKPKIIFRDLPKVDGIFTFSNVCIETLRAPILRSSQGFSFNETQKIVIYESNHSTATNVSTVTLNVAGSWNSLWNHWDVQFHQQTPQHDNRTLILRDTAFFVQPTCPGNFHHFFIDEFISLYSVVSLSNRLHPGARNQILYRTPQFSSDGNRCFSKHTYEGFLRSLYIDDFHDVFYELPNNTCFEHAVFGNAPLLVRHRDVIDHVLRYYNLTLRSNMNDNDLFVTVLQRKERRIINAEDVLAFAKEVGFENARLVEFEGKSIRYQLDIMSTSNVFIGVQGAGLQWSVFMPEGSYLIELAWPQKHWDYYFEQFVVSYGIKWMGLAVQDVRLNWNSYEVNVRHGVAVSDAEKQLLIRDQPKDVADNIWKWSDIVVQENEAFEKLEQVFDALCKPTPTETVTPTA